MKIVATLSVCVQIGVDEYQMEHHSKVFDEESTIKEILIWGKSFIKFITINDIKFSVYHNDEKE